MAVRAKDGAAASARPEQQTGPAKAEQPNAASALAAENELLRGEVARKVAEVERLNGVLGEQQKFYDAEIEALRFSFRRDWDAREAEFRGAARLPVSAPVTGRLLAMRARHVLHCNVEGKPTRIDAGSPIPDGADLTGIDPGSIERSEAR